ncbi:maleylpyruvate isomerase family mycothiol-dependent enzyme [Streptomyces sp. CA-294286]|uniref:maleylpyruvate isomerase family mycothiol-dependent enzyme n=1 Tax=Streptomyces sp. CA-294286 TaxID=3240070 RepID=UPI003D8CAE5B
MTLLGFAHYCDRIVEETALMRAAISGADLTVRVPSCPDWTLRQLVLHTGGAHRWVYDTVRTRSAEEFPPDDVTDGDGPDSDDPAALDAWFAEGAELCAAALREAGPDARVWAWAPGNPVEFWARRMTHETVVHRADAALAAKVPYEVAPEVAADAIDEWMWLSTLPQTFEEGPGPAGLLGEGRTLHLHATDAPPGVDAEWVVDLTGDSVRWRRGHEKAAVALRGPLTDLLQVTYRRRSPDAAGTEVRGDRALLDEWLDHLAWD